MLISVHDKTLRRVTFLDNEKPNTLHYFDETWHRYLTEATSTFDFFVPKTGNPDIMFLNEKGYVSFRYGGRSYLFNIMKVEETEKKLTCYCENLNLELLNETNPEYKAPGARTFVQYLNLLGIQYAQLEMGINEVSDLTRNLEWTGQDTKLARLLSLVNKFDAECEFVTFLSRDGTLDKIVLNVYRKHDENHQGVGTNRKDITLYYGKEIKEIRRTVDKTGLYTAIKPIGTDGLTIAALDKTELDADGNILFRSPAGDAHIYCPSMRDEYPSQVVDPTGDRYINLDWSYETNNVNTLYGQALAKLKSIYTPAITYEVDGFMDLDIGDTVKMHDTGFTPLLLLEARVSEQEISFSQPDKNKTTFSNFRALENKLSASIQSRLEALIQAAIPYTADIITTNGLVFKNNEGSTTLTARVSRGTNIVTNQLSTQWYKDGAALSQNESITVNAADVTEKAVYKFEGIDSSGSVKCFAEVTIVDVADGQTGADGKTQYLHIKYSDDGGQTFTGNNGEDPGKWMGYYVDFIPSDSNSPGIYSWVKVEGPQGDQGPQGSKGDKGDSGDKGDPMGILELPEEPPTKYEGMLWKHTGTVLGFTRDTVYIWENSTWKTFEFSAKNIKADSFIGYEFNGSVFKSTFNSTEGSTNINGTSVLQSGELRIDSTSQTGSQNPKFLTGRLKYDGIYVESSGAGWGAKATVLTDGEISVSTANERASITPGTIELYSGAYGSQYLTPEKIAEISNKAPTSHASTGTGYGVGTTANYGHVKTRNDLGATGYANGEALSSYQGRVLNDKIVKNKLGTAVNLLGQTRYVFPSDGYLRLGASYSANSWIRARLYGSDEVNYVDIQASTASSGAAGNTHAVTFVKQGMVLKNIESQTTTSNSISFTPLT